MIREDSSGKKYAVSGRTPSRASTSWCVFNGLHEYSRYLYCMFCNSLRDYAFQCKKRTCSRLWKCHTRGAGRVRRAPRTASAAVRRRTGGCAQRNLHTRAAAAGARASRESSEAGLTALAAVEGLREAHSPPTRTGSGTSGRSPPLHEGRARGAVERRCLRRTRTHAASQLCAVLE